MEEKFQVTSSMEVETIQKEEFYEEIEAPKFVDFTIPNHFTPDDRFWFCSRFGCDQKHEEEMDSEAIYKNFVLRVMAARSPNVKLGRAMNRKPPLESKQCPHSAPSKHSKSRIPRLALVSSSISKKLVDAENSKLKHPTATVNPASTPKARVKHVAAKYMTSPRKKKGGSPKLNNAFRSVRNPKKTTTSLPKSKAVSKALVFNSPKKALVKKASEELEATPVTRLCEGVKKLQINTQKKSTARKPLKECTSERKKLPFDGSKRMPNSKTRAIDAESSRSVKSKKAWTKDKHRGGDGDGGGGASPKVKIGGDESSGMEIDEKSKCESEDALSLNIQKSELLSGTDSDSKVSEEKDTAKIQAEIVKEGQEKSNTIADDLENQNPGITGALEDYDDKENASNSDNIRNLSGEDLRKHDSTVKPKVKTKQNPSKPDKNTKENCPAGTGSQGVKNRKLKPTVSKPFRLRTDERGILKEATLEKKVTSHEIASTTSENSMGTGNEPSENTGKGNKKDGAKCFKREQLRPIKSRYKTSKKIEPKLETSSGKTKSPFLKKHVEEPQREIVCGAKSREIGAIQKTDATAISKLKGSKKQGKDIDDPRKKANVAQKSLVQGKRPATIPREPKFHSLHKDCTRNKT